MGVMELVFGDLNKKEVKKLEKIADKVEAYDEAMQALTDDELRAKTREFQDRCQNKGESLDSLLPEAFAAPALQAQEIGRLTLAETIPPRHLLMARRSGQALSIAAKALETMILG